MLLAHFLLNRQWQYQFAGHVARVNILLQELVILSQQVAAARTVEVVQTKRHFLIFVVVIVFMVTRIVHVAARAKLFHKSNCRIIFFHILRRLPYNNLIEHHSSGNQLDVELGIFPQWNLNFLALIAYDINPEFLEIHTRDNRKAALLIGQSTSTGTYKENLGIRKAFSCHRVGNHAFYSRVAIIGVLTVGHYRDKCHHKSSNITLNPHY